MGKKILKTMVLALLVLMCCDNLLAQDVVNINIDEQTFTQLSLNTGVQIATNELHNRQVDSIKQKQSRLMTLVTEIAAQKGLLIQSYKNVSGFKKESKYYIAIAKTGADIIKHSALAVETIEKAKLEEKAMAVLKVSDLVSQAISLGKAFADIVADCEVPNPLKQNEKGKKDKYNLLNRHERLYLANDILFRLRSIDHSLCYLIYLTKNAGWKDLLFHLDRKTYITYIMTRVNTNDIINKWERVKK